MTVSKTSLIVIVLAVPGIVLASGTISGRSPDYNFEQPGMTRRVDQLYEIGKALYQGKIGDYGRIKYCVADEGSDVGAKLRGKSVKPYKGGDAYVFAEQLYNCKDPKERIAELLAQPELFAVLYYLDKRYKMKMTVSSEDESAPATATEQPSPEESG